jgi:hypothetical protein
MRKYNVFRCPVCKAEESDTQYLKIKSCFCRKCKRRMEVIHCAGKKVLKLEQEIDEEEQK